LDARAAAHLTRDRSGWIEKIYRQRQVDKCDGKGQEMCKLTTGNYETSCAGTCRSVHRKRFNRAVKSNFHYGDFPAFAAGQSRTCYELVPQFSRPRGEVTVSL